MRCKDGIIWKDLNPAVKRRVKDFEKDLEKKAYVLWPFENPHGEVYLFARLGKKKDPDNTIVTVAIQDNRVIGGWNTLIG